MIERKFVEKGIKKSEMETYLNHALERADYSHADIKRTPMNTRIVIHAGRPGVVIGHSGSKINEITETLRTQFKVDNPQIEVKAIPKPDLDPVVVAKQIASSLERGMKHRQIVNLMLKKIMQSGAIGVEITISGKISGARSRSEKFMQGYLKKCGNTSDVYTLKGYAMAVLKAGMIGVRVKLMTTKPSELSIGERIEDKLKEKETEEKENKEKEAKKEAEQPSGAVEDKENAAKKEQDEAEAKKDDRQEPHAKEKKEDHKKHAHEKQKDRGKTEDAKKSKSEKSDEKKEPSKEKKQKVKEPKEKEAKKESAKKEDKSAKKDTEKKEDAETSKKETGTEAK